MEEKRSNTHGAVDYYAKAFSINRPLLDVRVNPRILDTKLVDLALIKRYPNEHARESMQFQPTPPAATCGAARGRRRRSRPQIVTPATAGDRSRAADAAAEPAAT